MLTDFRATLGKYGIAKNTQYVLEIAKLPNTMQSLSGIPDFNRDMMFFAESAEIPGTQMMTQEIRYYGLHQKFAYHKTHDDANINFRMDGKYLVRRFFDLWIDSMYDKHTGDMKYKNDYVGSLHIWQLGEDGSRVYGVELQDCFPTQIGQLSFGFDQSGQYQRQPVTFSFRGIKDLPVIGNTTGSPRTSVPKTNSGSGVVRQVNTDKSSTLQNYQSNNYRYL